MTAILLALGSSVGYGVSDFLASRVARRVPPVLLVLYSQALQSVVLLAVVVAVRQPYSAGGLAWGTASGAIGAAGLVAYYQALATGQTAIVAPLASSGAVLPVLVDLARGERPGPLALAGLVMVLAGIAVPSLASEEPDEAAPAPTWHGPPAIRRRAVRLRPPVPVLLALVAAVLFGLFFIGVDQGGVAVTTFGTLARLPDAVRSSDAALLIVDETHFIKNPEAARSQAVEAAIAGAQRTLFLTGTPMENRVQEFRSLVDYLQPRIAARVSADDAVADHARNDAIVTHAPLLAPLVELDQGLGEAIERVVITTSNSGSRSSSARCCSSCCCGVSSCAYPPAVSSPRTPRSRKVAPIDSTCSATASALLVSSDDSGSPAENCRLTVVAITPMVDPGGPNSCSTRPTV